MAHFSRMGAATAALLACASVGLAQESTFVDQQNDPVSTRSFSCGTPPILNGTILQTFVPTEPRLAAVELRLRAGAEFPAAGVTTTIRIREDGADGAVLAEADADIDGPQSAGTQLLVRFELEEVALNPGTTYQIEWFTPNSTTLTWVGSGDDPYTSGTAFSCLGTVWPGGSTDFNFTTFALPEAPQGPKERIAALHKEVASTVHGKLGRYLGALLRKACRGVEKNRTRWALCKLSVFRCKVRWLTCWGVIGPEQSSAWRTEAREIQLELIEDWKRRRTRP